MPGDSSLDAWDFELPRERIATRPLDVRSNARLMHLDPRSGRIAHHRFDALPDLLRPGDLLVANDVRVMAARLSARRGTGGAVELLLLSADPGPVDALARPARKLKIGEVLALDGGGTATILDRKADGVIGVQLSAAPEAIMAAQGSLPLPPYLDRAAEDIDTTRYQTVFANELGAAAAPTAGLHFDAEILAALSAVGIGFTTVTLFVGLGTFRTLRPEDMARGRLHTESYVVGADAANAIAEARTSGGRIVAVGTTSARTLEAATPRGATAPTVGRGTTDLFVQPGYTFGGIDALITNLHLPRSSLLMLVAALVGRRRLLAAYQEAIDEGYRFYSYGDAMLLL